MTAAPQISFVIPVRDDAARLSRCLRAIAQQGDAGLECIVIDNGSGDGSGDTALAAGATVIRLEGISVAAARNAGAAAARGSLLAFVDADHEIAAGWLDAAAPACAAPGVGAAGTAYRSAGRTWVQRTYDGLRRRSVAPRPTAWLGSGNLVVRRTAFEAVGGFDASLDTCEDVDFCRRLRAAGWTIVDDPALVSVHAGDPATLSAVFRGERWRGRDNLRVSFRPPYDWRSLLTALLPAATGLLAIAAVAGLAAGAPVIAGLAACVLAGIVAARAAAMCRNLGTRGGDGYCRAIAVAAAYEAGRSAALVSRAGHRSRRAPADRVGPARP